MRKRTRAREFALQMLYQLELTTSQNLSFDEVIENFWEQLKAHEVEEVSQDIQDFAIQLVRLVKEHQVKIDELVEDCAEHWKLSRMAVVDRNILRLGTCEMLYGDGVPPRVAINEAIEMAKKYGDQESSRFVNGILDQVAKRSTQETD